MNGHELQRDFARKLHAVGAITESHLIALLAAIDAHEHHVERAWARAREREREEWAARPWWGRIFRWAPR